MDQGRLDGECLEEEEEGVVAQKQDRVFFLLCLSLLTDGAPLAGEEADGVERGEDSDRVRVRALTALHSLSVSSLPPWKCMYAASNDCSAGRVESSLRSRACRSPPSKKETRVRWRKE